MPLRCESLLTVIVGIERWLFLFQTGLLEY
jgi:hypothetical protein